ncbi:MAG: cupin domain-containing protein [Candidatus Neomarinimicrobiota bacterium]|nr:MAG: cupin domain-containing protein [Candidatus Neomarinimicrobiota bacterium]
MIITRHWKEVPPRENSHKVDARDLYRDDNALIVHLLIKAGEKLLPHKTPVDVAFYVLEGRGIVFIGEEKKEVEQGTMIESPKDITHFWYNESKKDLRILVIKVPNPKSNPKII